MIIDHLYNIKIHIKIELAQFEINCGIQIITGKQSMSLHTQTAMTLTHEVLHWSYLGLDLLFDLLLEQSIASRRVKIFKDVKSLLFE